MNTAARREQIIKLLTDTDKPLSATAIASHFSVSRQVIVGDIALLRAAGSGIIATPRGYLLEPPEHQHGLETEIVCMHDDDRLAEELYTVVDLGGAIIDVTVEHSVYGQICAPLHICSRFDADAFLDKLSTAGVEPLCKLTGGIHLHCLRCPNETVQARVLDALRDKGLLFQKYGKNGSGSRLLIPSRSKQNKPK